MPQLLVIIPAYNEERTVRGVVRKAIGLQVTGYRLQVVVVDDGSKDQTAEVARASGAIVLRHPINRGLGAALATGLEAALQLLHDTCPMIHDSIVVTLDADGQHDPAEIPRVVEPIVKREAEVVIGSRFHTKLRNGTKGTKNQFRIFRSEAFVISYVLRRVAGWIGNVVTWLLFGIWVSDSQSGFRAFSASAASKLNLRTSTMEVSSEIIREVARLKLRLAEVPVTVHYTPYSLAKGQGFLRGIETLWKLIVLRFFR